MPTQTDSDPDSDTREEEGQVHNYDPANFRDFSTNAIKGKEESDATGGTVKRGADSVGAREGLAPSLTGRLPTKDISGKDNAAEPGGGLFKDTAREAAGATPGGALANKVLEKKIDEKVKTFFSDHKKGLGAGGGLAAGIISIFILFGSVALTNELNSIITTMIDHFFANASTDVEKETDKLVDHEIKRIMKRLGPDCKSSEDECATKGDEEEGTEDGEVDPVDELDTALDSEDFAAKLADAGYKLTYNDDGTIHMSTPEGGDIDVTKYLTSDDSILDDPGLSAAAGEDLESTVQELAPTFGSEIHETVEPDILEPIGVDECAMDCEPGQEAENLEKETTAQQEDFDQVEDYKASEISAANADAGVECLLEDTCNSTDNDDYDSATGSNISDLDKDADAASQQVASEMASEDLGTLTEDATVEEEAANPMADAAAQALAKLASGVTGSDITAESVSEVMSQISESLAGPVKWVQLFAQLISTLSTLAFKLRVMNYLVHHGATIFKFIELASALAEQKSGGDHVNLLEFGSLVKGLSANGSTASQSEWYQEINDPNNTPSDVNSTSVNKELENEKLNVNNYNNKLTAASDGFNDIPGSSVLAEVAGLVNDISNGIFKPITWLVGGILNATHLNQLIAIAAGAFMKWFVSEVIGMPDLAHLGGKTDFDTAAEGSDFNANDLAEADGGEKLTPAQSAMVTDQQEQQQMQQFQQQPLFARIFSTDTPYSLVSKLSLDMPWSFSDMVQSSMADLVSDPFSKIFNSFSTIFTSGIANAATAAQPDPAGITQYGFPNNAAVFGSDPETYWQQHDCAQQESENWPEWNSAQNTSTDPNTGQEVHNTANGCLLIIQSASSAGAIAGYPESSSN